jgi:hypothetical protein
VPVVTLVLQGFNTALYTEMIFPPPVAIMPADLPLIHEAYVTKGPLGTGAARRTRLIFATAHTPVPLLAPCRS